ncbi:MAG: hypothetical protein GXW85_07075 [Clostridia bacterium]|nr:hypothetical protein [Clostridia bacterium]
MLWKKKSRMDDLAPVGWMILGAVGALTLVSLVNRVPEETIDYGLKKITDATSKVPEKIKENYEKIVSNTLINDDNNIDTEEALDIPKIKKVQGILK